MTWRTALVALAGCMLISTAAAAQDRPCWAGGARRPLAMVMEEGDLVVRGTVTAFQTHVTGDGYIWSDDGKFFVTARQILKGKLPRRHLAVDYRCMETDDGQSDCNKPDRGDDYLVWRAEKTYWAERASCFPELRSE